MKKHVLDMKEVQDIKDGSITWIVFFAVEGVDDSDAFYAISSVDAFTDEQFTQWDEWDNYSEAAERWMMNTSSRPVLEKISDALNRDMEGYRGEFKVTVSQFGKIIFSVGPREVVFNIIGDYVGSGCLVG